MKECVIVIPVHSDKPSENELRAFVQCYRILGNHPIFVVAPKGLDVSAYKTIKKDINFKFINTKWLSTVYAYNYLKRSLFFYQLFKEYKFLLTYELDAWVFRDELKFWYEKDLDYIGAPWFKGFVKPQFDAEFFGVGNSGFSLRNVQTCRAILNRIERMRKLRDTWFKLRLQGLWSFEKMISKFSSALQLKTVKYIGELMGKDHLNEDYFWTMIVTKSFNDFKVASIEEAIPFSFEVNPSMLHKMNKNALPFGCHGWEKYEPEFWRTYINVSDVTILNNCS